MGKNQHVTPHKEGGWQVKGENQESELFIHGKNGRIRERDSYGNDPFPPRG